MVVRSQSLADQINAQVAEKIRIANQGARASISTSLNSVLNQIDEKKQSIREIDNGTYKKPTSLSYNGNRAYFNGQYFTRGRNGRRLNEEETKEAWAALRRGLQKSLNGLLTTKQALENSIRQFS